MLKKIHINRNNFFDYIRLYASFQVLISHGSSVLNYNIPELISIIFSYSGVSIFFALSGFLVTIAWINSGFNLKKYLISRCLRIFPALCVSALISFILIIIFGKSKFAFSFKGILWLLSQASFLTFWNPDELRDFGTGVINGSLWTITVELQFYIILPFLIGIFIYIKKKSTSLISSLFLIIIAALSVSINHFIPPLPPGDGTAAREGSLLIKLLYVSIAPYLCTFIMGMLLALIVGFLGQKVSSRYFLFFGIFIFSMDNINITLFNQSISLWIYPIYTALIFIGIGLISNPLPIKFDISYGLYLYHMVVVNLILKINEFYQVNISYIYFFLSIFLAFISWYLIESPIMKLKKNILKNQ